MHRLSPSPLISNCNDTTIPKITKIQRQDTTVLSQEGVHKTLVCLLKIILPTKSLEVFDNNSTVLFGIQLGLLPTKVFFGYVKEVISHGFLRY